MHDVPHNAKIDNKYEDTHIIELNLNSSDSVQIFTLLSAPSSSLLFGMDNFVELIPCGPKVDYNCIFFFFFLLIFFVFF